MLVLAFYPILFSTYLVMTGQRLTQPDLSNNITSLTSPYTHPTNDVDNSTDPSNFTLPTAAPTVPTVGTIFTRTGPSFSSARPLSSARRPHVNELQMDVVTQGRDPKGVTGFWANYQSGQCPPACSCHGNALSY